MKPMEGSKIYPTAVLLTVTGGFLDAYTYFVRGKVFANAQTGNIIKLGIAIAQGNTEGIIDFLMPITAFCIGILTVLTIKHHFKKRKIRYIHRAVLIIEILSLLVTAFLPQQEVTNVLCNIIVSFVCAMQMEAFKTFMGQAFATTVSTGNLRKFLEFLYRAVIGKKKEDRQTALQYFLIVLLFIGGVILGTISAEIMNIRASLIPVILLCLSYIIIAVRYRTILKAEREN